MLIYSSEDNSQKNIDWYSQVLAKELIPKFERDMKALKLRILECEMESDNENIISELQKANRELLELEDKAILYNSFQKTLLQV